MREVRQIALALTALVGVFLFVGWNEPLSPCDGTNQSQSAYDPNYEAPENCRTTLGFFVGSFVADVWDFVRRKESLDGFLVLFTAALAAFTFFLFRATNGLLRHAPQVERAYISGGGGPAVRMILSEQTAQFMRKIGVPPEPTPVPTGDFQLHINNHGKTPGEVLEYGIGFCEASAIPPGPIYISYHFQAWIAPGTNGLPIAEIPIPQDLTRPVAYGRFHYRDIFAKVHSAGFILEITGGKSKPILAPEAYTSSD